MVSQPKKSAKKTKIVENNNTNTSSKQKNRNTGQAPRKQVKLDHKKKAKEVNENVITEKKVKVNMKKTITKLTKLQRLNLQLAEERKQYVLQRIASGNQQFEEDKHSEWYTDHPILEEMSASSISPSHISETSEVSEFTGQNKRVSFTESQPETHCFTINRLPPKEDNPIFDVKKTWISQLMSKKPKKAAIKIMINKRDLSTKNEESFRITRKNSPKNIINQTNNSSSKKYYHEYLGINENISINYDTLRVFYPEDDNLYLVNTSFSYTQ